MSKLTLAQLERHLYKAADILRRRQEAVAGQPGHVPGLEDVPPQAAQPANDNHHADNDNRPRNGSVKPLSFRERIALERQRQDQGPSLP